MSKNDVQIVASTEVPTIEITREFDAPVEAVFRAHTDPELFARWVGPKNLTTRIDRWTPISGGNWRYVAQREGEEHWFHGCFHDVRENERIVQTFTYEGWPDGTSLEVLTFTELPGGRCRLRAVSGDNSFESREAMLASGMEHGVREGYEALDELLAEQA